jgi:predicted transglutaminase-like cysteine proteinase
MRRIRTLALAAAAAVAMAGTAMAIDAGSQAAFLPVAGAASAPLGAAGICRDYDWACAGATHAAPVGPEVLRVATVINRAANTRIRPVSDMDQYATAERWSLPTKRGGDCEDYALFKKLELIKAGVSPDRLLMAAVLDRQSNVHAVLVLRTAMGDYVLDNLTNRILLWNQTGYVFLRMQDPAQPARWVGSYVKAGSGLSS